MDDDVATEPRPEAARTSAEYVALLRRLRTLSCLTYREISDRAETAGDTLPVSTLATMLGRTTLPREQAVKALVSACGLGPDEVARWIEARRRLAVDAMPDDSQPAVSVPMPPDVEPAGSGDGDQPEPVGPPVAPGGPRSGRLLGAATLGFLAGALVATVVTTMVVGGGTTAPGWNRSRHTPATDAAPESAGGAAPGLTMPAPGRYRLRLAHSGLCVSERPGSDLGHVFQADCAHAMPPMTLAATGENIVRIRTDHPDYGPGCMGVDHATREVSAIVSDGFCDTDSGQDFRFEPVTTPTHGFHVRPVHSDMCLGVLDGSSHDWAPIRQLACDAAATSQVFLLDPA